MLSPCGCPPCYSLPYPYGGGIFLCRFYPNCGQECGQTILHKQKDPIFRVFFGGGGGSRIEFICCISDSLRTRYGVFSPVFLCFIPFMVCGVSFLKIKSAVKVRSIQDPVKRILYIGRSSFHIPFFLMTVDPFSIH